MKYFYAFEFASGPKTTAGEPNGNTGCLSIAGSLELFDSKSSRDAWVEQGQVTADMQGNCRRAISASGTRTLCMGMSVSDYDEHLSHLKSTADIRDIKCDPDWHCTE